MEFGGRSLAQALLVLGLAAGGRSGLGADDAPSPASRLAEACRKHGLDPASPLESRVRDATPMVYERVNYFRRADGAPLILNLKAQIKWWQESKPRLAGPEPRPHATTEAERLQLRAAVELLPSHQRRVLMQRVRGINFVDEMLVGGTVVPANPGEPDELFDIAINASVLRQTASDWLTQKEQTVFVTGDSPLGVRIDVGPHLDALTYVLLHEATHVVDEAEGISRPASPIVPGLVARFLRPNSPAPVTPHPFTDGVWSDMGTPAGPYLDPRRQRIVFYDRTGTIPLDDAPAAYASLAATPFVSLYSGRNCMEDLAEYASVSHLTEVLHRPYRIVLHIEGIEILVYEPMKSDLVRRRIPTMNRFYD